MPSAAITLLETIAPAVAADARAETYLELLAQQHTAARWGNVYTQAMAYLLAHVLTVNPSTAPSSGPAMGQVSSRTAGDVSETYAVGAAVNLSPADADLARTIYGQQYMRLRASRGYGSARTVNLGGG